MGSRSKIDLAYIAGFLDGDGSLMLQLKKRSDSGKKWRFMATICFYQDSRHEAPLEWIRNVLGIGYLSRRNDGMSELRINGFKQVRDILKNLSPYIKFKKEQATAMSVALDLLLVRGKNLDQADLVQLIDCLLKIQKHNYVTKKKKSLNDFYAILGLTP
ncbi:MAG TPA: LAGLIDADG family homing endonuclease [Candidatus Paceibacterota bacterium]|nr:LAGLIDADG family homing endonuclease [Candidatus Paceibacterota bacterium]